MSEEKEVHMLWLLPDGSRMETSDPMCPECHHAHTEAFGGICVGCPCPITAERRKSSQESGS